MRKYEVKVEDQMVLKFDESFLIKNTGVPSDQILDLSELSSIVTRSNDAYETMDMGVYGKGLRAKREITQEDWLIYGGEYEEHDKHMINVPYGFCLSALYPDKRSRAVNAERLKSPASFAQHLPESHDHEDVALENLEVSVFYLDCDELGLLPVIILTPTKPIQKGEIVGYSYGDPYWQNSYRSPAYFKKDGTLFEQTFCFDIISLVEKKHLSLSGLNLESVLGSPSFPGLFLQTDARRFTVFYFSDEIRADAKHWHDLMQSDVTITGTYFYPDAKTPIPSFSVDFEEGSRVFEVRDTKENRYLKFRVTSEVDRALLTLRGICQFLMVTGTPNEFLFDPDVFRSLSDFEPVCDANVSLKRYEVIRPPQHVPMIEVSQCKFLNNFPGLNHLAKQKIKSQDYQSLLAWAAAGVYPKSIEMVKYLLEYHSDRVDPETKTDLGVSPKEAAEKQNVPSAFLSQEKDILQRRASILTAFDLLSWSEKRLPSPK